MMRRPASRTARTKRNALTDKDGAHGRASLLELAELADTLRLGVDREIWLVGDDKNIVIDRADLPAVQALLDGRTADLSLPSELLPDYVVRGKGGRR